MSLTKHWPILIIFLFGFFLRTMYLPSGAVPFSYDQARDAYTIKDLLSGDLKIQGPPTSTRDFFHGVLYYYALAPGYWLGHGSPLVATAWMALLNSAGIFLAYYIGQRLFHNRFHAALLALLYAISYEQTQYSLYLTNTALATVTVPTLYFGLWLWRQGHRLGPVLSGLAAGLSFQANFLLIYHLAVVTASLVFRLLPVSKKAITGFLLAFLVASSTMWLSEIKFGLPSLAGPASLLTRSSYSTLHITSQIIADTAVNQFVRLVGLNLLPQAPQIATLFFMILFIIFSFRHRPSWWWLFALGLVGFAPALILGGISSPYIHVGLGSLVLVFAIYFASRTTPLILVPVILANIAYVTEINPTGRTEFAIQKTMTLSHELAAIDYIYAQAEGQPFSISTIAAPLNINTTWSYLFNWYGREKYGYLPYWHGADQSGQSGDNLSRPGPTAHYFLIIEPSQGLPEDLINSKVAEENKLSNFNHKKQFGEITVHNRTRK